MKIDLYTKVVLTVIAAALVLNLLSPVLRPTIVRAKAGDPIEDIAREIRDIGSTLESIESYGLKVKGTSSSDLTVKIKD